MTWTGFVHVAFVIDALCTPHRWPASEQDGAREQALHTPGCGPRRSFEAVELATLEWVDWFNNRRLLEPTSRRPKPEERYSAMLEEPATAA